jgi:3-hydroxybutyryl-CoA dehydrogenase
MKVTGIRQVSVIGAGLMGLGIGVEFARFGYRVNLYNTTEASSRNAMQRAHEDLDLMVETELITRTEARAAYRRLHPTTDLTQAAMGADYVVESVPEVLSLKKEIFIRLDELCSPPAILASNTSGFLVTDIASVTKHPERIVATNYYQPPHFVPLVEVVGGKKTKRSTIERTVTILRSLHKKAVVVNKEIPGLIIGNRIQRAMIQEIQSLVDEGAATPQMIDDVLSFGLGPRMIYTGIFRRIDLIGLDFLNTVFQEWGLPLWKPITERVKRGELGMKTGKGFYEWPGDTATKLHRRMNTELIRFMKQEIADGVI